MRPQSPDGIGEVGTGDGASGEKQSRPPQGPTSILLRVLVLVLDLLVDDTEGGEEVAQEEDGKGEAAHEHLPLLALGVLEHAEQGDGIVELPELPKEEEGKQEREASPHPGLEALHSQVHVVPLSQRSQPVQAPALVVILQELHKALVHGEGEKLVPEHLVHEPIWPRQHDT